MSKAIKTKLSDSDAKKLVSVLEARFEKNMQRHKGIKWSAVQKKLDAAPDKLWSLNEMERTGGEPDVIGYDKKSDRYIFFDCSAESPQGRRSLCYDSAAWRSRKEHKPKTSTMEMAGQMGIEILNEEQYRLLQEFGSFDAKSSSWIQTPDKIRKLGGALFCDRRYDTVFVYHNGAESYYAARGFRAALSV